VTAYYTPVIFSTYCLQLECSQKSIGLRELLKSNKNPVPGNPIVLDEVINFGDFEQHLGRGSQAASPCPYNCSFSFCLKSSSDVSDNASNKEIISCGTSFNRINLFHKLQKLFYDYCAIATTAISVSAICRFVFLLYALMHDTIHILKNAYVFVFCTFLITPQCYFVSCLARKFDCFRQNCKKVLIV